jgi:dTDP-glucose pyrophosphorylase/predicted transcriptional regulator
MQNIKDITIGKNTLLKDVLKIIDQSSKQICLVLDENKKLLGTISDGDIRRALLRKISLDDTVENVYFKNPTVASINDSREVILNICKIKKIHQIPVVDNDYVIVGLETLDELIGASIKQNKVVLMVGGIGTRLRPLTDSTPKPLLHVGGKPILQTIVERLVNYGFVEIIMCIGYKSNMIQDFFEDGSKFGANIKYIHEEKRLGTAGALSLLEKEQTPKEPFFVMNGDLLTNVNFEHLLDFHLSNHAQATMCVREYDFQVPYGVVNVEDGRIKAIDEKPTHKFFVSAGIYVLNPPCIDIIPKNKYYDMPLLFEEMIKNNNQVISFPLHEYWLDIGRIPDYEKANNDYNEIFLNVSE